VPVALPRNNAARRGTDDRGTELAGGVTLTGAPTAVIEIE
jgi:hypothetical protein